MDEYPGALWKEQAVTLEEALDLYVTSGARLLRLEEETGSLEPGKLADLIVLNQHLFEVPVKDISQTELEMTLFEGNVVYRDPEF